MKCNKKKLAAKIAAMLTIGLFYAMPATYALPTQGTFNNTPAATITTADNVMNIAGKGKNNILNWANFQVGKGETVNFAGNNNYLNLVHGVDISRIYGTISGGNTVYLVNPNGILFGQGTKIDNVGAFVASTRNISSINKEAFLNDPSNTAAVLGTDNTVMDNKDYYPENSPYVPKITVAEMQLTNVPASATEIILDGPGGVILKNTALLDQTTQITTRQNGGEIGIGSDDGNITLTDAQKAKIDLIDGNRAYGYDDSANVLQGYQTIDTIGELSFSSGKYMIVNDLDASGLNRQFISSGVLEGMGYSISNFRISVYEDYGTFAGLFEEYTGDIRNLNVENVNVYASSSDTMSGCAGGLVACFSDGLISNVNTTGQVAGTASVGGLVGGLSGNCEIRNSTNNVTVRDVADDNRYIPFYLGGIAGSAGGEKISLYNVVNNGVIEAKKDQWGGYVGGIIGQLETIASDNNCLIQGAYNSGDVIGVNSTFMWLNQINVGGIIGGNNNACVEINEAYNLGVTTRGAGNGGYLGGIIGENKGVASSNTSKITGEIQESYYLSDKLNLNSENIGIGVSEAEMAQIFNKDMIGVHDFSSTHGDVTSGIPDNGEIVTPPVDPNPNPPIDPDDGVGDDIIVPKPDVPSIIPPVDPNPDDNPVIIPPVDSDDDIDVKPVQIPSDYDGIITVILDENDPTKKVIFDSDKDNTGNNSGKTEEVIKNELSEEKQVFFESMVWADNIEGEKLWLLEKNEQYEGGQAIDGNMYITGVKTEPINGNEKFKVEFDIYNAESVPGVVEIYDANGNRIKVEWIEPFKRHAENAGEAITDLFRIGTGEISAKRTPIEIEVPAGGYFRITNNVKESTPLSLHSFVNEALNATGEVINLFYAGIPGVPEEQVRNAVVDVIADEALGQLKDASVNGIKMGVNKVMDSFINGKQQNGENRSFNAVLENVKKDLNAKGVIEGAVESGVDILNTVSPAGVVTKPINDVLFLMNKVLNKVGQIKSIKDTEQAKATNFTVWY